MGDWLNRWRVWSPGHFLSAPGPIIGSLFLIFFSYLFLITPMSYHGLTLAKTEVVENFENSFQLVETSESRLCHFFRNIKIDCILNSEYIGRANFPTSLLPLVCRFSNIWAVLKDLVVLVDVEGDKTSFVVNCADLN